MVNKITTPPTTSELIDKVNELVDDKQDTLVSGTNIKTINNTSILGSGNIDIQGGSSYTAGTGIDITNDIISVTSAISSGASAGATAVQPSDLSTYVTTNTAQDITARKTFFGEKAIHFKQNIASNKLGFTLYNNNNKEVGALEFRPNSINGTPILTLNSSSPLGAIIPYVGFRYWNYSLNILAPFSTSLANKNFFIPVTFTNGTTTIESTSTNGSVDISSLLPTVNNATLTITQGGVSKGTFTANASSDVTIALDSGGGSDRNIGEIVTSTIPLSDAGLHLLDGALISGSGSYADFVTYIAGLVSDYPDLFETEVNWQTSVTNYGVCGKFVYDSVNNTVRLPKITGFIEGTTDTTALGDLIQAGLPNITGNTTLRSSSRSANGAFYVSSAAGSAYAGTGGNAESLFGYALDASRSSSIYGNSSTVQPQAIKVLYYIVIATSTKTQIEVDIDEIVTDLNGKADTDLSNTNLSTFATKMNTAGIRTVVETYSNGTNWYRIYSDGWCEQGGISTGAIPETVTLLKPYKDTNGSILITPKSSNTPTSPAGNPIASWISNSQIQVSSSQSYWPVFWETKGYIA